MERRPFSLGRLGHLPEHFARRGKIEPAIGHGILQRRQHIMGAVDVRVQRGKFVFEGIGHEALRRQVIAFLGLHVLKDAVEAGEALQRRGMQAEPVLEGQQPPEPVLGILDGDAADNPVHFIVFFEQELRQVRSVLPRDAGDQRAFHGLVPVRGWRLEV